MIFLRILLLASHLAVMNFAAAGPLAAIWIDVRGGRQGSQPLFSLARSVAWQSFAAFVLAMILGAANGLVLWGSGERQFFSALLRFWDTKVFFGWWELAFYAGCVGGYLLWRTRRPAATTWERYVSRFLLLLAGTNLLYHFPPLFAVIQMLARGEGADGPTIDSAQFRQLMATPHVIWLSIHFLLASISVTGLIVGRMALRQLEPEPADKVLSSGALSALIATVFQAPVGAAFLLSLPQMEQRSLMGSDMLATVLFVIALVSAFWLMHVMTVTAFFDRTLKQTNQALATTFGVILLMTAAMLLSRA